MKVRDIMTKPPQTCRLETPLGIASRRMNEADCGTLAVLDHHGRVGGILTDRDLAMALGKTTHNAAHVTAEEAMTRHVHTCTPDETVKTALQRMTDFRVRRLPVIASDGDLQGMLSVDDIIMWGVEKGGVTRKDLVRALRSICSEHVPQPEAEPLEVP
jgi:CBS domain-containing protein